MTARELIATAALAGRIVALHVAVQCCGLRRVRGWLGRRIAPVPAGDDAAQIVALWRVRLKRIKRRLPAPLRGNCLSRSLALWWMLARHGVPATLCIGARRDDGDFGAHAWVEHEGVPINAGRRVRSNYATFEDDFARARDG